MAKLTKIMTLTMAIVFLIEVRASDISTSYNTSINPTLLDGSSTLSCWILRRVTPGPLFGTVFAFGLIGNSLSFAVLHKYSSGNVGAYLLKALAITDNIFLATTLGLLIAFTTELATNIIIEVLVVLASATMSWTVWMIVIVAGNRYIAVCRPMVASRLCTINKVQLEILIVVGAVCVFNIPHLFNISGIMLLYIYAFHGIFVFLLPLAIIIFFNVHLMRSLQLAQRSRMVMTSGSSNDGNNITIVMIAIIIVFLVCQAPIIMSGLIAIFYEPQYYSCVKDLFIVVSLLLMTMNSSVNFVIYCVFRRQFRNQLCMLFGGVCGCPWQQHPDRQPNDA